MNETPTEIASLVWEITKASLSWGRIRIANQLQLLGIFISAFTVRNIFGQSKHSYIPGHPEKTQEKPESRSIPASHPNHVWCIGHVGSIRSRLITAEGLNTGWGVSRVVSRDCSLTGGGVTVWQSFISCGSASRRSRRSIA